MRVMAREYQLIIPEFSMKDFHMSYLDRRHYQLLIAVSRRRQLTPAAEDLGLTQPAASHQIREAERRLGVTLFKRSGRWMDLTPAAERLLMAGLYAEDTLKKAELDAVEMDRNSRPTLRIALGNYDNVNWLPAALKAVEAVNPEARIELLRCSNLELRNALQTGHVDCFITPHDAAFDDLDSSTLFEDELVAIFPPNAQSQPEPVAAADFDGWKYIAFQPQPSPGFEYERFFQRGGHIPENVFCVETSTGIVRLVTAGVGASILPSWSMSDGCGASTVIARHLAPEPLHVSWELYANMKPSSAKLESLEAIISALKLTKAQTLAHGGLIGI
jgi:LysR family transcriptional regulator for metE and metH